MARAAGSVSGMRMSEWSADVVRFMEDASAYGSYFMRLTSLVLEGLAPGSTVCDAGCGLGQLALGMACAGMAVDAIDVNPRATAHAAERARRAGRLATHAPAAGAVRVSQGDFRNNAPGQAYDRMVFSLSASAKSAFELAQRAGAQSVVVVNKIHATPVPEDACRPVVYNLDHAVGDLCALGLTTSATDVTLHFDQPFRSLEDAQRYFALFRTRTFPQGAQARDIACELQLTGRDDFPWVLPVRRHLACFRIQLAGTQAPHIGAHVLDRYFAGQGGILRQAS